MFNVESPAQRAIIEMLAGGPKQRVALEAEFQQRMGSTRELALLTFNAAIAALIESGMARFHYADGGGLIELTAKGCAQGRFTSSAQPAMDHRSAAC